MKLRPLLLAALFSLCLLAPSARADEPVDVPATPEAATAETSAVPAAAEPKATASKQAQAKIKLDTGGNFYKGRALILSKVNVTGTLSPWVPGQSATVYFYFNGKKYMQRKVKVKRGKGDFGVFKTTVAMKKGGKYAVSAKHIGNGDLSAASTKRKSWKIRYPNLEPGQCSRIVRGFREGLNKMGYVPSKNGCVDGRMQRAVLAFRKVNGMDMNFSASKKVVEMVFKGQGAYKVTRPDLGKHIEAPLSKQVIVFAKGDRPYAIFPVSSGAPATPTIRGTFNFYMTQPGYNDKGMYYSFYFIRGYAIHGYKSVPNYPASHGCLRTFIADQPRIYNMIDYGMPITVF